MEGLHQQPEQQPTDPTPRIYVASLADYNDGRLHGEWIDATQEPEDIYTQIDDITASSPIPGAQEWAIHDFEGFGGFPISEHEHIDTVILLASGITKHGPVFASWVDHVGTTDVDLLDRFDEHYLGTWDSLADYAEQLTEDLGVNLEHLLPNWLSPYLRIDYQQLGSDLASELYVTERQGGVDVFEGHA